MKIPILSNMLDKQKAERRQQEEYRQAYQAAYKPAMIKSIEKQAKINTKADAKNLFAKGAQTRQGPMGQAFNDLKKNFAGKNPYKSDLKWDKPY